MSYTPVDFVRREVGRLLRGDYQGRFLCAPCLTRLVRDSLSPTDTKGQIERGLHAVFSIADSGAAYVQPGLNISDEVVKRLDAAAAAKK